jgi:hypothetical protein
VFVTPPISLAKERRENTRFHVKLGNIPIETYEMLRTVYGEEGSNRSFVLDCFERSKDEVKDRQNDP